LILLWRPKFPRTPAAPVQQHRVPSRDLDTQRGEYTDSEKAVLEELRKKKEEINEILDYTRKVVEETPTDKKQQKEDITEIMDDFDENLLHSIKGAKNFKQLKKELNANMEKIQGRSSEFSTK